MRQQHSIQGQEEPGMLMDINTTPLIDVMLVLLVMLIITLPIQLHAVNLALPLQAATAPSTPAQAVRIDIAADGGLHWQGEAVSAQALADHMAALGKQSLPPELHIRCDQAAQYAVFAHVLSSAKRNGLTRIAVLGSEQFAP